MIKNIILILGILGALIILYGTTQKPPQVYYITGAVALLVTAAYFRLLYFIALELILIAGHFAILLGSGPYTQFALPVLLSCQLLVFYLMYGKENIVFLILGIWGVAVLSVAYAFDNHWIFLIGSTFIATYSYYNGFKGLYPAYIWAFLNTSLILLSLYKLFIL